MAVSAELLEDAIMATGEAARNEVLEFAKDLDDELLTVAAQLTQLAYDIHRITVKAACRVLAEAREDDGN
jgi:glycerol dehydrogenase-like iron-containing ADH family enzyme